MPPRYAIIPNDSSYLAILSFRSNVAHIGILFGINIGGILRCLPRDYGLTKDEINIVEKLAK